MPRAGSSGRRGIFRSATLRVAGISGGVILGFGKVRMANDGAEPRSDTDEESDRTLGNVPAVAGGRL